MGNSICKIKKNYRRGQGTLELAVSLILIIILIGGVTKNWLWGNQQFITRQRWYNLTRVLAGHSNDVYFFPVWKDGLFTFYHLDPLREGDVLISGR